MARSIAYIAVDFGPGWYQFRLRPDNSDIFDMAYYAQMLSGLPPSPSPSPPLGVNGNGYPAGFTASDQRTLNNSLLKLCQELSKSLLNATSVVRDGYIYTEAPAP